MLFLDIAISAGSSVKPAEKTKQLKPIGTKKSSAQKPEKTSWWTKLKGKPTPNRLMLGMFSLHLMQYFKPPHGDKKRDNWNNQLIAFSYRGYFAGTLVNSLYKRAYVAGIERYWYSRKVSKHFGYDVGYRLGLITGYTQKTYWIAKYTPVLPFPQVIFDLDFSHVQVEFYWCFQVIGAGFAYRF